jgi:hypothetical protein
LSLEAQAAETAAQQTETAAGAELVVCVAQLRQQAVAEV